MGKVTLYVPTYNRSIRLKKCLSDLIDHVLKENLTSDIDILVGDNCSTDATSEILQETQNIANKLGIILKYFRNVSNLGFNENIRQGYLKFEGDYILFISDDDNLYPGALSECLKIITKFQPYVALMNFDQNPFTINSPLYKETLLYKRNSFDFLKPLILFPKLTGIALKKPIHNCLREEISSAIIPDFYLAHVSLAIYQYSKFGSGLQVSEFLGYPDKDCNEHVVFPPYINNFARIEIDRALKMGRNIGCDQFPGSIIDLIPDRIVIDDSINWLFNFYCFKRNLTQEVFSELWSNCLKYLFGHTVTKSGMNLNNSKRKLKRLKIFVIFLLLIKNQIWKMSGLRYASLGEKSFEPQV